MHELMPSPYPQVQQPYAGLLYQECDSCHHSLHGCSLTKIPCRYAGLMRGAIAVALVYYYFDPRGQAQDSHRATINATTILLVLFSTVVFSAATKPLLEFMLGPQGECHPPHIQLGCHQADAGVHGGLLRGVGINDTLLLWLIQHHCL